MARIAEDFDFSVENARDLEEEGIHRVLLMGNAGGGKTTQVRTLPGKTFMYAFDPNIRGTLKGFQGDLDLKQFLPDIDDVDLNLKILRTTKDRQAIGDRTKRPFEPLTYIEWEEDFEERAHTGWFEKEGYNNLWFDSFTTFQDMMMDRILWLNGHPGKQPEHDDWAIQINSLKMIWRVVTSLKMNIVATAHTEMRQDDVTSRVYQHIMLTGRLRTRLPQLFTDIFPCMCQSDATDEHFVFQTRPSREWPTVRCSFRDLEMFHDATIYPDEWNDPRGQAGLGELLAKAQAEAKKAPSETKAKVRTNRKAKA